MRKTFIVKGTVKAGTAVNSIIPFKIVFDPVRGEQDFYQTPTYGGLAILPGGIYVEAAQPVNGILRLKVNGVTVHETAPINTLLISNPSRPKEPDYPLILDGGDKLEVEFVNLESPEVDQNVVIYVKVDEETG